MKNLDATFLFFFYSSLSSKRTRKIGKTKKKGGEGKAEAVTIAKITESRLFSIQ